MVSWEDTDVASVDMFTFEPTIVALFCDFIQLPLLQTQLIALTCFVLEDSFVERNNRGGLAGGWRTDQSPRTELPQFGLLAE